MTTLQEERPRTREEWAERTVYARRRARFSRLLTRARQDVAKDLPLAAAEWREIAAVYTEAAQCGESAAGPVSACCGEPVRAEGRTTRYYVCISCGVPCDARQESAESVA